VREIRDKYGRYPLCDSGVKLDIQSIDEERGFQLEASFKEVQCTHFQTRNSITSNVNIMNTCTLTHLMMDSISSSEIRDANNSLLKSEHRGIDTGQSMITIISNAIKFTESLLCVHVRLWITSELVERPKNSSMSAMPPPL